MKDLTGVNKFIAICGGYTKSYRMDFCKLMPKLIKFEPNEQKRELLLNDLETELEAYFYGKDTVED